MLVRSPFAFRTRVIFLCALLSFGLSVLMLGALITYVGIEMVNREHDELVAFERRLATVLDAIAAEGELFADCLSDGASQALNNQLSFLFDEKDFNLTYAVYDPQGTLLYEYSRDGSLPFDGIPDEAGLSFVADTYKDWRFFRTTRRPTYQAVVCSSHHVDTVDHFLIGLAVLLPLGVAASMLVGTVISRRVLQPLKAISATVERVEKGDLSARIDYPEKGDEVAELITTLNQTFAELESSFSRISQFSADAAHELRTPLTAIRGTLEVCVRQPRQRDEYEEAIGTVIDETARLNTVIDVLLTLAREPRQEKADFAREDFAAVIEGVASQMSLLGEPRQIGIVCRVDGPAEVMGSALFLQQLCYNLIHNAIKFSPDGAIVHVELSQPDSAHWQLQIRDHGCGIPKDEQLRVFDRFYQADASRNGGSGLGLSLCKWIVELHSGRIALSSEPGKGTTMKVTLPRAWPERRDETRERS